MSLPDQPADRVQHNQPNERLLQKYPDGRYDTLIGVILAFAMAIGVWIYAVKPWQTKQLEASIEAENPSIKVVEQPEKSTGSAMLDRPVVASQVEVQPVAPALPAASVAVAAPVIAETPPAPLVAPLAPVVTPVVTTLPPAPVPTPHPPTPVPTPEVVTPPPTPVPTPEVVTPPPTPVPTPEVVTPPPTPIATPVVVAPTPAPLPPNVVIRESIEFEMGQAKLPESAKARLLEVAALLKSDTRQLKIVGHTDSIGFTGANRRLSLRRANSVKAFLVAAGVDAGHLSVAGAGEAQPIDDNNTVEGRHHNRRIEIIE